MAEGPQKEGPPSPEKELAEGSPVLPSPLEMAGSLAWNLAAHMIRAGSEACSRIDPSLHALFDIEASSHPPVLQEWWQREKDKAGEKKGKSPHAFIYLTECIN